jgi:hypothetical protein
LQSFCPRPFVSEEYKDVKWGRDAIGVALSIRGLSFVTLLTSCCSRVFCDTFAEIIFSKLLLFTALAIKAAVMNSFASVNPCVSREMANVLNLALLICKYVSPTNVYHERQHNVITARMAPMTAEFTR